jgi:tetratricopeptide (TPR) repeat protein
MALTSALELDSALSLQEIQPLLKDDNPWVRKQAVECARKIEAFPSQAVVELFKQEENAAVVESILEYFISRNLTQAIPMIFDRIKTEPEEELPWLISALGHLGAVEELGKVKKFLSAVRSEVLTEYYRALLQNGDLSILDEVNEAISGKKREQDLVQWAIIAGELGLFFRNTENYSTKLMTSLAAEVEKDMAGIAGFDQVPAGAPNIQDFGRIQEILEQRDYGKARPELENFLKSFPEHDEASYGLANCMYQSGETDGAVAILERLFHRNPSYLDASVLLGQIFFRRKDWGKLAECYEKLGSFVAPTDKRNVIRVYGALGLAYFHQKRFAEAIEALGKGLKANPRDLSSSYHLALCHYAMGNTSIAREILEGLRKTLPPDSQVLKNVLELLQRIEVTV